MVTSFDFMYVRFYELKFTFPSESVYLRPDCISKTKQVKIEIEESSYRAEQALFKSYAHCVSWRCLWLDKWLRRLRLILGQYLLFASSINAMPFFILISNITKRNCLSHLKSKSNIYLFCNFKRYFK